LLEPIYVEISKRRFESVGLPVEVELRNEDTVCA